MYGLHDDLSDGGADPLKQWRHASGAAVARLSSSVNTDETGSKYAAAAGSRSSTWLCVRLTGSTRPLYSTRLDQVELSTTKLSARSGSSTLLRNLFCTAG